ncbi:hypothetical protein C8R48DRAFT_838004, partial [Suillus tomentosus]
MNKTTFWRSSTIIRQHQRHHLNSTYDSSCSLPISLLTCWHPCSSGSQVKFHQWMRYCGVSPQASPHLTSLVRHLRSPRPSPAVEGAPFVPTPSYGHHRRSLPKPLFLPHIHPTTTPESDRHHVTELFSTNVSGLNRIPPGISKHEPAPNIQAWCTQSPTTRQSQEHLRIPSKWQQ